MSKHTRRMTFLYDPCQCHVLNPEHWPDGDGSVRVATCMRSCPYCAKDCGNSYALSVHLCESSYQDRGIRVNWSSPLTEEELQPAGATFGQDAIDDATLDDAPQNIPNISKHFDPETRQLLESISLSSIDSITSQTRKLWEDSTASCPSMFGFQECWVKSPPTAALIHEATTRLISNSNSDEKSSKGSNGEEMEAVEMPLRCILSHSSRADASISESPHPWKALAQLHQPDPEYALSLTGFQLPDILPDSILEAPDSLKQLGLCSVYTSLATQFFCSGLLIDSEDEIVSTIGPCQQLWLLFPPTTKNLQLLNTSDVFSKIADGLEGGIVAYIDSSQSLYKPVGCLNISYTTRGGFIASSTFANAKSVRGISSLVSRRVKATDCGFEDDDGLYDRFLGVMKLALLTKEVTLGLEAWIDAYPSICEWLHMRVRNNWQARAQKLWGLFFDSPCSKNISCPCSKMKIDSFEKHFRSRHLAYDARIASPVGNTGSDHGVLESKLNPQMRKRKRKGRKKSAE